MHTIIIINLFLCFILYQSAFEILLENKIQINSRNALIAHIKRYCLNIYNTHDHSKLN